MIRSAVRTAAMTLLFLSLSCGGGGGGGGGGGAPALTGLSYSSPTGLYRVGEAIQANAASISGSGFSVLNYSVSPSLPAGLTLNSSTGSIEGTPTGTSPLSNYTVTVNTSLGSAIFQVAIAVGPQMSADFLTLAEGYSSEVVLSGLSSPVRLAQSSDGRIFFNQLDGVIRVVDASGNLLSTPFATLSVLTGNHKGLIGLALSPDFATDHYVYVTATVAAGSGHANRLQLVRYTESNNVGMNPTVIVDDLPMAEINNSGQIVFDHVDNLFLSIGDVQDPSTAQADTTVSLAGKVLRYTSNGLVPADNPYASSPEWCRGLRNTFALAVHPVSGDLFGADNGAASDDELNYLGRGMNGLWGLQAGQFPGVAVHKLRNWSDVIVPTSMLFSDAHTIFMTSYDDEAIRKFIVSGSSYADLDEEVIFAELRSDLNNNKPLCIIQALDGSFYVSTFTKIYRIFRFS